MAKVRKAAAQDIESIDQIYVLARQFMSENGNCTQWTNGYPGKSDIIADINEDVLFVTEDMKAVMALIGGDDPTYLVIDGAWHDPSPYMTIHRIASIEKGHGQAMIDYAKSCCSHLRIDTHRNNLPMRRLLEKNGFVCCGTIESLHGPRMAFEWSR